VSRESRADEAPDSRCEELTDDHIEHQSNAATRSQTPFGSFQPAWGRSGPLVQVYTPSDGGFYNQNWSVIAHYTCDETAATS
jgi:hypothetical protein